MLIGSSYMHQRTSDCCCRSLCRRGRRCQARARIPKSASGRSQTICPARGWVKRRSGPGVPISKIPPATPGPPDGGCCPAPFPGVGGVPGGEEVPFPPVFTERLVAFVEVFARGPPPNPPRRRSLPLAPSVILTSQLSRTPPTHG